MTDDSLDDTQRFKCVAGNVSAGARCKDQCERCRLESFYFTRSVGGSDIDSVGKFSQLEIATEAMRQECVKLKIAKMENTSVLEKEVWNAAIEAAALSMDDYGFQISSAIIRRLKK